MIAFNAEFSGEVGDRIMSRWKRNCLGLLYLGANFVAAWWFTAGIFPALALTFAVWLIHFGWQEGFALLNRRMAARYFASLPESEWWTCEVTYERITMANRGVHHSFRLSDLSRVFERSDYLYLDFASVGRLRIPFSAFRSISERCDFTRMLESKKPNKAPEPTLTAVMPPAAQESRRP